VDAVYEAHAGELPNDWRYEACSRIWDYLVDIRLDIADGVIGWDDVFASAIADDGSVRCDVLELIDWLSPTRLDYCDRAMELYGGANDVRELLADGYHLCVTEMADVWLAAVQANPVSFEEFTGVLS
jgi:hypothetical protein